MLAYIIDCLSNNYPYTLEKLYILNPSTSLSMMWKVIAGKKIIKIVKFMIFFFC